MLIAFALVLLWLVIEDARSGGRRGGAVMTPERIALPPRRRG